MKDKREGRRRLPREILILFLISLAITIFVYFFLRSMSGSLLWNYCEAKQIVLDELESIKLDFLMEGGSFLASVLLFFFLFLFLIGRKLSYLQVILDGIEALRIHRLDYVIPLKGENELTNLAESINYLSKTERELSEKEKQMKKERELLVRALSHDIRTPLTSIRSYSEMMKKELLAREVKQNEMMDYVALMQRKAEQMRELTEQLLESSKHKPEFIQDGKLLMEQLVCEWEEMLEDRFELNINLTTCPLFSGEIDIREFQRIFDNLYTNIEKYADPETPVELTVDTKDGRLCIRQRNKKKADVTIVESHQIGMLSMKAIAGHYGGSVEVSYEEDQFEIQISLLEIKK